MLKLGKYQKNMADVFEILLNYGDPKLASRYAKRIIDRAKGTSPSGVMPGTTVYMLVEELAKYLPEEINCKFIS